MVRLWSLDMSEIVFTSTQMERGAVEFPNHGHFELPEILDANGSTKVEGKLGPNNGIREGARVDALHLPVPTCTYARVTFNM